MEARMRVVVRTVLMASAAALAPMLVRAQAPRTKSPPRLNVLLSAAASYLDRYEQTFSAVVAEELYTQTMRGPSGTVVFSAEPTRRDLRSDVMVLNLGTSQWVEFRDVYEVDNSPLPDHEGRLQKLFQTASPNAMSEAQRFANESARYHVGVSRTINVPTMALAYLSRRNQFRSAFELAGSEAISGVLTQVVQFEEIAAPSLVETSTETGSVSGRFGLNRRLAPSFAPS